MQNVEALIEHYKLLPHPEGGWYKETYRSKETIPANSLSSSFTGSRSLSTAIYFLLEQGNFSAFIKYNLMNAGIFMPDKRSKYLCCKHRAI